MKTVFDGKNNIKILSYGLKQVLDNEVLWIYTNGNYNKPTTYEEYHYSGLGNPISPWVIRQHDLQLYNKLGGANCKIGAYKERTTLFVEKGYEIFTFECDKIEFAICCISKRRNIEFFIKNIDIDISIKTLGPLNVEFEVFIIDKSPLNTINKMNGGIYMPQFSKQMNEVHQNLFLMSFFGEPVIRYMRDIINDRVFNQLDTPLVVFKDAYSTIISTIERTEELTEMIKKFKCNIDIQYTKVNAEIINALLTTAKQYMSDQYKEAEKTIVERLEVFDES